MLDKKTKTKKVVPQKPKGMKDIFGEDYYQYQGIFEKAQEVAVYYGFNPIETPILEQEELFLRGVGENTDIIEKEMYSLKTKGGNKLVMRPEGTASVMRAYIENGMQTWTQPVMFYYSGSFFRHERPQRGRFRQFKQFGLEAIGTDKSIADALIIKTTLDILKEVGYKDLSVDINSIGDADCKPAYLKALTSYYRKHIKDLCSDCKERIKTNPLRLLDCKDTGCAEIKKDAPEPVSHLCQPCKKHFKEVLEYLDILEIPYKINAALVRGLDYYTRTVFEIIEKEEIEIEEEEEVKLPKDKGEENKINQDQDENTPIEIPKNNKKEPATPLTIAAGGRYDGLSKIIGSKKQIDGVGAAIGLDRIVMQKNLKSLKPRIMKKPKIYFIQLGFEAKLKSLSIIEILRTAKIPIAQSLSKDSLSAQLAIAEKMKVPYTIIFGQKEAIDGTAIVRSMDDHSQKTVKIEELSDYLKNLK